ncbi:MAG TPA: nitrile hydratase accessory protein [Chthoniobacterales bacterium]
MAGGQGAPPRSNGELCFRRDWEGRAFGMAIALSKKGHFEWEEFRQELITAIAAWEEALSKDDSGWDYYQRWFLALEKVVVDSQLVSREEVEGRTTMLLKHLNAD